MYTPQTPQRTIPEQAWEAATPEVKLLWPRALAVLTAKGVLQPQHQAWFETFCDIYCNWRALRSECATGAADIETRAEEAECGLMVEEWLRGIGFTPEEFEKEVSMTQ